MCILWTKALFIQWLGFLRYFGAFSDVVLTKFWIDFENYEVKTIVEGLKAEGITPGSGKSTADVSAPMLYHILSKPTSLADPLILPIISSQPLLPRAIDWPMEPPPAGYFLLVAHENQEVREWATGHVGKAKSIPQGQFTINHELCLLVLYNRTSEGAVPDSSVDIGALSSQARHIDSAFPFSHDRSVIWAGLTSILQLVPVETYEKFGLHRTIMNHLHDNAPRGFSTAR